MSRNWNLVIAIGVGAEAVFFFMRGYYVFGILLTLGAVANAVVYGAAVLEEIP